MCSKRTTKLGIIFNKNKKICDFNAYVRKLKYRFSQNNLK